MKQHLLFRWGRCAGLLSILLLWVAGAAFAQGTSRMKGTVLDEAGQPLAGVTVLLREADQPAQAPRGTATDAQGLFGFDGLKDGAKYDFTVTYVGYGAQTVKDFSISAGDSNSLLVRMSSEANALNDVVVIGYGAQSKAKVTGVISEVKAKELTQYSGSSFAQQLTGRAAGVVVNDASAQPGTDPQIVIRGIGTLTAGRNPLIVVDGFPLSEGSSLNSINPQDIEKVDILKDPSSAAVYGSRAANGVILITTKKGRADKLTVALDVYTGTQRRTDRVQYVDAYDAAQFFTEARDNGYLSKNPAGRSITDDRATRLAKGASLRELRLNYLQPYLDHQPGLTNTNWLNELFRPARLSSYNLSFAGGSAKTSFYVSANYFDQQGIVLNHGLKRYSATVSVDSRLSDKFTLGVHLNPSYNSQAYFANDVNNSTDLVADSEIMYPFFSPRNPDGSLAISQQIAANGPEDGALGENVIALAYKVKNDRTFYRTFGNTYLSYQPLAGLTFKTLLGGDITSNFFDYYNPSDVGGYRASAPKPAVAIESRDFNVNYLTENTLTYDKEWQNHSFNVLAGTTYQEENGSNTVVTASGIADNKVPNIAGGSAFLATANRYTWTLVSYLARAQYAFRNKYLLSVTVRRDGSSRFGTDRKWGNFPSITGGWILTNESFVPKSQVLTFAKLRGSYGQSGNNQIGSYSSQALVNSTNYVFGSALAPGFAATTTANSNLSWETKTSADMGLDLTLFGKLTVTADYYNSTTKDLLLSVPVPQQSGFSSSIQNIGKVRNSGFELALGGGDIKLGPVTWGFGGNLATNRNEVLALAPGQTQIITGADGNFRTKVGGPIAELYGYNITGIYKTQDDINKTPHLAGTLVGDYVVQDINGDGVVDSNDRTGFGTYNPKFTYGFSSSFDYQNFELSFALVGIRGRKIYDRQLALFDESGEGFAMPSQYYFDNRYNPATNPDGFFALPNLGNFSPARRLTRAANLFYKNADYLRLRDLRLAYRLPKAWVAGLHMAAASVYVSANNLFTITQYRGYNPDATSSDNVLTNGQAQNNYPVAKAYLAGFNLTF